MKLFGLCATTLFFPPGGGGGRSSPEDMGPKSEGSWDSWGDNRRKHFKIDSREIDVRGTEKYLGRCCCGQKLRYVFFSLLLNWNNSFLFIFCSPGNLACCSFLRRSLRLLRSQRSGSHLGWPKLDGWGQGCGALRSSKQQQQQHHQQHLLHSSRHHHLTCRMSKEAAPRARICRTKSAKKATVHACAHSSLIAKTKK